MKIAILCNICSAQSSENNAEGIPIEIEYKPEEMKEYHPPNKVAFVPYKCPMCGNQVVLIFDYRE